VFLKKSKSRKISGQQETNCKPFSDQAVVKKINLKTRKHLHGHTNHAVKNRPTSNEPTFTQERKIQECFKLLVELVEVWRSVGTVTALGIACCWLKSSLIVPGFVSE